MNTFHPFFLGPELNLALIQSPTFGVFLALQCVGHMNLDSATPPQVGNSTLMKETPESSLVLLSTRGHSPSAGCNTQEGPNQNPLTLHHDCVLPASRTIRNKSLFSTSYSFSQIVSEQPEQTKTILSISLMLDFPKLSGIFRSGCYLLNAHDNHCFRSPPLQNNALVNTSCVLVCVPFGFLEYGISGSNFDSFCPSALQKVALLYLHVVNDLTEV